MNKIFFFDIDGTLAVHGKIPQSNIEALNKLKELGYPTFICTGRAGFYAKNLFKDLVSGYIACNGRYIIYNNEKLLGVNFDKDALKDILHRFDQIDCGCMLVSDDYSIPYHLNDQEIEGIIKDYGKNHVTYERFDLPVYTFDIFYKDLVHRDKIIEEFKDLIIFNDHGGVGNGDCSTLAWDKGNAIAYLLEYFNISKDHAYAFGDGYNDIPMFREVNNKIAMGNGVDELKEKATFITDTIDQQGITKALRHLNIIG